MQTLKSRSSIILKKISYAFLIVFICMNIIAMLHAYRFTHFEKANGSKTPLHQHLSMGEKINALIFGIRNPKPLNKELPSIPYHDIYIDTNQQTSGWLTQKENAKGTFILCHGYASERSSLLQHAYILDSLGYRCLLIDFQGSGNSKGNSTTIGFEESGQVSQAVNYMKNMGEENIYLLGNSMGAAAIMKALNDEPLPIRSVILESPFGSLLETVKSRFKIMKIPSFPMANLLTFWGGALNGFNSFNHNPKEYAIGIKCPVLLMRGALDDRIGMEENEAIYKNIPSKKQLIIFPKAGHENFLNHYRTEWKEEVLKILK
jgi:pimeloyl-ACP methyl ester carboxylesterase